MASLYILIPIAIIFVCIAVAVFIWAVKSEQFEDLERQGTNILFDEEVTGAAAPRVDTSGVDTSNVDTPEDKAQIKDTEQLTNGTSNDH